MIVKADRNKVSPTESTFGGSGKMGTLRSRPFEGDTGKGGTSGVKRQKGR